MLAFFRLVVRWSWRLLLAAVLFFNCRLYWPSPLAQNTNTVPGSLRQQLNANAKVLTSSAPRRMQQIFPEGFYFCHVLHGLTWVEAAQRDASLIQEAISNAKVAYENLDSQEGRDAFPSDLPPDHGAFYSAWKVHLLAGIVMLQMQEGQDVSSKEEPSKEEPSKEEALTEPETDLAELQGLCDDWQRLLKAVPSPFFESYHGAIWPCDTLPAIHAMKTCDRITDQDKYQVTIDQWLKDVKQTLDSETGLIPHSKSQAGILLVH